MRRHGSAALSEVRLPARSRSIKTASPSETEALGRRLGRLLGPGAFVGLIGELGSGKTVVARGIARGLGYEGTVGSPSFVIVNEYAGRVPVYHIDLYRLASAREVETIDYRELFFGTGVAVVEWAEKGGGYLPGDRLEVSLTISGRSERDIELVSTGPVHGAVLASIDAAPKEREECPS